MTEHDSDGERGKGIKRRQVLQGAAAASVVGLIGVPGFSGSAVAQSGETLYLTDTQDDPNQNPGGDPFGSPSDDTTKLYEVTIASGNANLTELLDLTGNQDKDGDGIGDYNHVVAIATSTDGETIWGIDKFTDRLFAYDVPNGSFSDVGEISDAPGLTLQAAVSPDNTLYITGFGDTGFYRVDTGAPSATKVATITDGNGNTIEAGGADFVFDAAGDLYFVDARSVPRALYRVTDITDWDNTTTQVTTGSFGPGLSILGRGTGNLVYSDDKNDQLVEIDTGGSEVATYPLKAEDGSDFDHQFGDLAVAGFDSGSECEVTLFAGQDIPVGTVTSELDATGSTLSVTFQTDDDWYLAETHLEVVDDPDDFPTGGGNPKVGQFSYGNDAYGPGVQSDSFAVDVSDLTAPYYVAAHAVVYHVDCETAGDPSFWASGVVGSDLGTQKDGDPLRDDRDDPTDALGAPDGDFVSLGFDNGYAVFEFDYPVYNSGDDADVFLQEVTFGRDSYPEELADVYVRPVGDDTFVQAGQVSNKDDYDGNAGLGAVGIPDGIVAVDAVKVVNATDPANFTGSGGLGPDADGYDLDAVGADCLVDQEETAWGDGCRFTEQGNWATYTVFDPDEDVCGCP